MSSLLNKCYYGNIPETSEIRAISHSMSLVSFHTPWKHRKIKLFPYQRFSDVFRGYGKRKVAWNGNKAKIAYQKIIRNMHKEKERISINFNLLHCKKRDFDVFNRRSSTCWKKSRKKEISCTYQYRFFSLAAFCWYTKIQISPKLTRSLVHFQSIYVTPSDAIKGKLSDFLLDFSKISESL